MFSCYYLAQQLSVMITVESILSVQYRVTTCLENLENLEMSWNYTDVREMSGISLKVMEMSENCQGKNLVMENCPKSFIIASTGFLLSLCKSLSLNINLTV